MSAPILDVRLNYYVKTRCIYYSIGEEIQSDAELNELVSLAIEDWNQKKPDKQFIISTQTSFSVLQFTRSTDSSIEEIILVNPNLTLLSLPKKNQFLKNLTIGIMLYQLMVKIWKSHSLVITERIFGGGNIGTQVQISDQKELSILYDFGVLWPHGKILYIIERSIKNDEQLKPKLMEAIEKWNKEHIDKFEFVEAQKTDVHFIKFERYDGQSHAHPGYWENFQQFVNVKRQHPSQSLLRKACILHQQMQFQNL